MSAFEKAVVRAVVVVVGLPFIVMVVMLLVSMSYAMYTDLVDPGVCW